MNTITLDEAIKLVDAANADVEYLIRERNDKPYGRNRLCYCVCTNKLDLPMGEVIVGTIKNRYNTHKFGDSNVVPICLGCGQKGQGKDIRRLEWDNDWPLLEDVLSTKTLMSKAAAASNRIAEIRYSLAAADQEREKSDWWEWYNEYLKSKKWAKKRKKILKRDPLCQACLKAKSQQAHHLTYDHVGDEFMFELIGVCIPCHKKIHKK